MEKDVLAKQIGYLVLQLWDLSTVVESLTTTKPPVPNPPPDTVHD